MKHILAIALAASMVSTAMADELPLKRVILSTAGLAQFTHSGEVAPGTVIDLSVRVDQVDDMLKSLTIFDTDSAIGAVSLPGKAPLRELFRDLPFPPAALDSLPALLNALVGSEVEIEGNVTATGRLLKLTRENIQLPDGGGQKTQHRLSIMSESGVVQAVLEELSSIRFTDAQMQTQIDKALAGLAANRAKERRTLSINLLGERARQIGFSYVVAAPVWKTAYRLVLPKEGEDKARLQGWAVVENLTGNDWSDVKLSLVSGSPVALKQSLYTAFYSDRPEIPVTTAQRILPRRDEADGHAAGAAAPDPAIFPEKLVYDRIGIAPKSKGVRMLSMPSAERGEASLNQENELYMGGAAQAAEAEEAATQIAYNFPAKITLNNGSTMMVPFVDREISAKRIWLYQPETNGQHPLASVEVENTTETAMPAGIITAFDRSEAGRADFAGDAQLPLIAKGAKKFVTFALDAKTDIRRTDRGINSVQLGKTENGVMTLTTKSVRILDYEITSPPEEDRSIVIDESRPHGWQTAGNPDKIELTSSRIRYRVEAPKGKTTKASLKLERTDQQIIHLSTLDTRRLYTTLRGLENTDSDLKETIGKLSKIVKSINEAERGRNELQSETLTITEDQERIRKNLETVGQSTDLGRRYLDTLRKQEDRLIEIRQEIKTLEKQIAGKGKEASQLAKELTL